MLTFAGKGFGGVWRTGLLAGCLCFIFCSALFAQKPAPIGTQTTSVLMAQTRAMLEKGASEALLPYLREILVRLEGNTADDAQSARVFCMFQIGVCQLQAGKYIFAAESFESFIKAYPDDSSASPAALLAAEAYALQQDWPAAEKAARPLPADKRLDDKRQLTAYQILSEALYRQQKWKEATVPLLELFSRTDREETRSSAALMLTVCYAKSGDSDNLYKFLPYCGESVRQDAGLNMALIETGDTKCADGDYQNALKLYQMVFMKEALIAHYERQMEKVEKFLDQPFVQRVGATRSAYDEELRLKQVQYDRMAEQFKTLKAGADYDIDIALRTARCYAGLQSNEVAYAIYKDVYTKAPDHELAEESRFRAFMLLLTVPQKQEAALSEGQAYLERYPANKYTDEVTLNLTQLLLASGKLSEAQATGQKALQMNPGHRFADQVKYLLAFIDFQKQDYESAKAAFSEIPVRWPSSTYAEASEYWKAMCCLFLAQYDEAIAAFENYLKNPAYPKQAFGEEAAYRLGVALYGRKDFPGAGKAFRRFLDDHPASTLRSEALCMLGDLHAANGGFESALDCYGKGLDAAANKAQVNYAVFQTAMVYERQKNYPAIIELMEKYIGDRGEQGNPAGAGLWRGKAYKAMNQYSKAVSTYMDTVVRSGSNPANDNVDMILRELVKEFKSAQGQTHQTELLNTFTDALRQAQTRGEETLVLRLQTLFAYITDGAEKDSYISAVLKEDRLEKSGALTLLLLAEESLRRREYERVYKVCDYFSGVFKSSDFTPDVMNCKLTALVQEAKYPAAVALAAEITGRFGSRLQTGLTRKLKADALRLSKQYDAAVKTYSELFAMREWRGPLIPESLYRIGCCLESQGKSDEAFAFFQRVYVLYEGYADWSAKAYEGSVRCLEKLGRRDDVLKTLREMLANADIAATPEGQRAEVLLNKLSASGIRN
jgi:TolA-binding protein